MNARNLMVSLIFGGGLLGFLGMASLSTPHALAQARLVDEEFTPLSCEDAMARADYLANMLMDEPGTQAYVIMYGDGRDSRKADGYAQLIHRTLIGRGSIESGVVVMRSRERMSLSGEFWLVRNGTTFSRPNATVLARIPMEVTGRVLFGTQTVDPCTNHIDRGFARVLKSNPTYTGEIIEFNIPRKEQAEVAARWLNRLRHEYGLTRGQLRIRFRKVNKLDPIIGLGTEFWLLAPRNK
jgi:hypothetical protein